jgi:hypothetical protein
MVFLCSRCPGGILLKSAIPSGEGGHFWRRISIGWGRAGRSSRAAGEGVRLLPISDKLGLLVTEL